MPRLPRHRSLVTAVVIGVTATVAVPHLVAAGASSPAPAADEPAAVATSTVEDLPIPRIAPPPTAAPTSAPTTTTTTTAPAPLPVSEPTLTTDPAPPTSEPAAALTRTEPAPDVQEPTVEETPATGTVTVEVDPTEGATRTVTLLDDDGEAAAGPVTVTGEPIVADLAPGVYDLLVEQFFDDGGTFLTRVRFTVDAGGSVYAVCDAESLDCTVVAA